MCCSRMSASTRARSAKSSWSGERAPRSCSDRAMIAALADARVRARTQVLVGAGFALFVLLSHETFLKLPFFWDELGQFVPAALDIFRDGAWIPHSTVPNVHPPGVMAYLAAVWTAAGYSIEATRSAMLALASLTVFFTFLLAVRFCRSIP